MSLSWPTQSPQWVADWLRDQTQEMRRRPRTPGNFHSGMASPKSIITRSKNAKSCDLSSKWRPSKFHNYKERLNEKGHRIAIKSWLRKALQLRTSNEKWAKQIASSWDSWRAIWIHQLPTNRYAEWRRCLSHLGPTPWISSLRPGLTTDNNNNMLREQQMMHLWHAVINSNRAAPLSLGKLTAARKF